MVNAATHSWGINLNSGIAIDQIKNDAPVNINSVVTNTYSPSHTISVLPFIGVGLNYAINKPYLGFNVGLEGYSINRAQITGVNHPFSNAGNFDTLNYSFSAKSFAWMFVSRFIYRPHRWQPYFVGGLGMASNRLNNFYEIPTNSDSAAAAPIINFASHTETSVAYEIGFGVQKTLFILRKFHAQVIASIDYRYLNLGSAQFSPIPNQVDGQGLQVPHINIHLINFGLAWQRGEI